MSAPSDPCVVTALKETTNKFKAMGDEPSTGFFRAFRLIHVKLTIEQPSARGVWFKVTQKVEGPACTDPKSGSYPEITQDRVWALARKAASTKSGGLELIDQSPFDIPVCKWQTWIILELDSAHDNWQFQKGFVGVTMKEDLSPAGQNCKLRHVYADLPGAKPAPVDCNQITSDGCRVVYFGVAQRTYPDHQAINLHTEFLEPGGTRRLQVIFDPDVPNDGPDPIP